MDKYKIINLTPHDLNIYINDELVESIKSSGIVTVKTTKTTELSSNIKGFKYPVSIPVIKEVVNLPNPKINTLYFVPASVRTTLSDRRDLISPSSKRDDIVKDENGNTFGMRAFNSNY